MRRDDIRLCLRSYDRAQLRAVVNNWNATYKLFWWAEIKLAAVDDRGTFEIMRRAQTSKPAVWRWQQRYLDEGVAGLKRAKTRRSPAA